MAAHETDWKKVMRTAVREAYMPLVKPFLPLPLLSHPFPMTETTL